VIAPVLVALLMQVGQVSRPAATDGSIVGVVVNGSRNRETVAGADVVLRAGVDGMLEPVETATTDIYGKFRFSSLPVDQDVVYLPGVNQDGVHYPGSRVQLDEGNWLAHVQIVAYDATSTSPLVLQRHDIDIEIDGEVLRVSETLWIVNRSRTTFVGPSSQADGLTTFRLAVPAEFDRVTFEREHYGRRFRIVADGLATDMPWPPGSYKIAFSYRLPLREIAGAFRRPLDVACAHVNVRIPKHDLDRVTCNLVASGRDGDTVIFRNPPGELARGFVIEVRFSRLTASWTFYSRLAALAALGALVVATILRWRREENHLRPVVDSVHASVVKQSVRRQRRGLSA
jgi:hypothetical protein